MFYKLILQGEVDGFRGRRWTFSPPAIVAANPSSAVCIEHRSISRQNIASFWLNGQGAFADRTSIR